MTGILPIKKCGQHSALNMFREFSIIFPMQLAAYTGFTEDEVKGLLEATWNCDEDKVVELLKWFHDLAENKTYNSEVALSYAIQMAYYAAQKYYTTI